MGKRKQKRKLTAAERAEKKRRREEEEYETIFVNGKQKRVKKPPTMDGLPVDEFIRRNADPIWFHQNEMWEYMGEDAHEPGRDDGAGGNASDDDDIPF